MRILIFCFFLIAIGCDSGNNTPPKETEKTLDSETQSMIDELHRIATDRSSVDVWHLNKERAQMMDKQLGKIKNPGQWVSLSAQSSIEWLKAGNYDLSIKRLEDILDFLKEKNLNVQPATDYQINELLAISYMRKGEIENCINNHNEYSCLLPIQKEGQHLEREGSTRAIEILRKLMKRKDATAQTKWLYNVAHMTLGGYPDQVEREYRIAESVFESDVEFPRFKDVAMNLGLAINDISGSVIMDDFNNDYYPDLMISSYGLDDQLRYFQNDTKGGFEELTIEAGLSGIWSGLNMVQGDYNNDGFVDVFVLRGAWLGKDGNHPNSLLKNNGDGTFSDVTRSSGLYSLYPTQTASWADFNRDGFLDLFIGNEFSKSNNARCQLYENNGDGTFKDVAAAKRVDLSAFVKGCIWGDYNNDGNPDLYVSVINGPNYLLENQGKRSGYLFKDVAGDAGVRTPIKSFPTWFFDYNQDGWEDIFVSGFDFAQFTTAAGEVANGFEGKKVNAEMPILYHNNGDGTFDKVSAKTGLNEVLYTMGCNFGDLNNDGFPDLYAATGTPDFRSIIPNRMFLNSGNGKFLDVTTNGGFGHLQKGHGVAFGDVDMDGDQDVYNVLGGSYDGDNFMNALFMNPGMGNNWVKFKLIGQKTNKSAIGARLKLNVVNGSGERRTIYHTINSGASFGANPLVAEIGLGSYERIHTLKVDWPGPESTQTFEAIEANHFYVIKEGDKHVEKIEVSPIVLKNEHHHHHH